LKLPDWVKPGISFKHKTDLRRKYHVRGIVDDRAIVRVWLKSKQSWEYVVKDPAYFEVFGKGDGFLITEADEFEKAGL
jgi:hypothetical protein